MSGIKRIIRLTYLALGSIALFISLGHFGSLTWIVNRDSDFTIKLVIFLILSLIAGIFLIICYYGYFRSKKYKYTGVAGCSFFIVYFVYFSEFTFFIDFKQPLMYISYLSTMIASIILLVLTLVYWSKIEDEKD